MQAKGVQQDGMRRVVLHNHQEAVVWTSCASGISGVVVIVSSSSSELAWAGWSDNNFTAVGSTTSSFSTSGKSSLRGKRELWLFQIHQKWPTVHQKGMAHRHPPDMVACICSSIVRVNTCSEDTGHLRLREFFIGPLGRQHCTRNVLAGRFQVHSHIQQLQIRDPLQFTSSFVLDTGLVPYVQSYLLRFQSILWTGCSLCRQWK